MKLRSHVSLQALLTALAVPALVVALAVSAHAADVPDPQQDMPLVKESSGTTKSETLVVAGGCFWGVEGVFEHVKGVTDAKAGYSGGNASTAHYETVSTGTTGHAESVQITYDPSVITVGQLLKVYFSVVADPTELNYQGPDHGTQYRSEIFTTTADQKKVADAYIAQLQSASVFSKPVVTKVEPLSGFYPAEDYHQHYEAQHPYNPYILINDAPKLDALKHDFPNLYVASSDKP